MFAPESKFRSLLLCWENNCWYVHISDTHVFPCPKLPNSQLIHYVCTKCKKILPSRCAPERQILQCYLSAVVVPRCSSTVSLGSISCFRCRSVLVVLGAWRMLGRLRRIRFGVFLGVSSTRSHNYGYGLREVAMRDVLLPVDIRGWEDCDLQL